ncbi:DNA segregation ATPase FtsK/SpoIIIE-like protein [Croceifilum oryzae]|uniref:DNA segregation ATPase FtsK/SpoIIIE-like protein n=1 Tax=Croceifilum oryzae TaxID=1553429 RepID=A0AAJ1TKV9_9BACL|nr:DNA translocase FtsK [Croceifilum oryzae]MDQ0417994.1 DNA segregation ATPase FtsK/SpoIIIE-like protein [Croceifilum oryzae]
MRFLKGSSNESTLLLLEGINQKLDTFLRLKQAESEEKQRDIDILTDAAIEIVKNKRKISIRLLERELRIGFVRASTIMERLEEMEIVSKPKANKQRDILID